MTARDVIFTRAHTDYSLCLRSVDGDMPLVDVLPRLLDSRERSLAVTEEGVMVGIITERSLLEGLGKMIAPRDDSSLITVECRAEDYCASLLAHAVEDAGAHLVDLWTTPSDGGMLRVELRVRHNDPSAAIRSLERYDFHVVEASGSHNSSEEVALERLMALQTLLNV